MLGDAVPAGRWGVTGITWNELKAEVDRQIEEKGFSGDEEISWFDLPAGTTVKDVHVGKDTGMSSYICVGG